MTDQPDPFVLQRQYEEGEIGRAALSSTGFVFQHCGHENACVDNYPFVLNARVNDGAKLALMLDRRCMALSPWSFSAKEPNDMMAGLTYLSEDRLFFSTEEDRIAAQMMLSDG